ncbi:MAG TPA: acyl-CoA dehydrogenase [Mycobacteriales bacterium]|nr:acyl-CoA dehydrogenase [Mycobacteriales bacterium]
MALAITDEHRALSDSVRDVLQDRGARTDARAVLNGSLDGLPRFWTDACKLGWFGLHVQERFGGGGHTPAEAVVVLEQLGAHVAPGPALPIMLAAAVLQQAIARQEAQPGTAVLPDDAGAHWLPGLCRGEISAAIALDADLESDGTTVSGSAAAVLGHADADLVLVPVGTDLVVLGGGPGLDLEPVTDPLDRTIPVMALRCRGARIVAVLPGARADARRFGRLFAAAQATGGIAWCLRTTVDYVRQREQFGRPVGSFQAVKHHCANMLLDAEVASAAVWDGARSATGAEAELGASVAAAMTLPAYVRIAQQTIQLHGGIGYTWEHDAHLYLRRATALAALFGPVEDAARDVHALRAAGHEPAGAVDLPPEAETYRTQAREFLQTYRQAPADTRQAVAARAGYVVPHWPPPYGRAADAVEQIVLDTELNELPRQSLGLGEWVLPTVLQHGTDDQRERLMWPSLEGTLRWCQLFSEPGAGSDAAAVSTRARRADGGWLVSGQKVWTSDARNCQLGLATVRTDPAAPKHAGITAMIIEMDAPGVEVRPLTEITGEALFNEVFFDDVFVPDANVVGAVNGGWKVARATLANERLSIGGHPITLPAEALLDLLRRHPPVDDGIAREVGVLLAESQSLKALNLQQLDRALAGIEPGPEGNIAKAVGAEHAQRVVDLGMRIGGTAAVLGAEPGWARDFLFTRCLTIAGGTSEVVRTQIAERILGLPRESL